MENNDNITPDSRQPKVDSASHPKDDKALEEQDVTSLEGDTNVVDNEDVKDDSNEDTSKVESEEPNDTDAKAEDDADSQDDDADNEAEQQALAAMKKLRSENKNLRSRLKAAEAKVKELESASSTDLQRQVETLTNTLRQERLNALVSIEAAKLGAIEPNAIGKLVDLDEVEWDNDKPTNVAKVLEATKKNYPKLFAVAQGSGNAGNRTEPRGRNEAMKPEDRIREALKNKR